MEALKVNLVPRVIWLVILAILICCVALFLFPIVRITTPQSLNYSEGWNSYWELKAGMGVPLYGELPGLTITNYPPLFFHLVGSIGRWVGDVTLTGRVIAIISLGLTACLTGLIVRDLTKSIVMAAYAGLTLLLWIATLTPGRLAINDPHPIALAISTLGLLAASLARSRATLFGVAGGLFAISLFFKNSEIAFPVAVLGSLLWSGRLKMFFWCGGALALVGATLLGLTFFVDGPFFIAHVGSKRLLKLSEGAFNSFQFLYRLNASYVIGVAWLAWTQRTAMRNWFAILLLTATGVAVAFAAGNGVTENIFYDATVILAILVSIVAFDVLARMNATRIWVVAIALTVAPVAWSFALTPRQLYGTLGRWQERDQLDKQYREIVALIQRIPGPAICESILMCFEAGKPFLFDPYYVSDQVAVGRLAERKIISAIDAGEFSTVQLGEDAAASATLGERLRFSATFLEHLASRYEPVVSTSRFVVYRPKPATSN